MTNEPHELSSAGARRRAGMLPLLQDAVRDRVRRKRRRQAVLGALVAFTVTIGVVELLDRSPSVVERSEDRLADGGAGASPIIRADTVGPDAPLVPAQPVVPRLDIQSIDAAGLHARAMERDPEVFITTPVELPVDFRTAERRVVVERVTTDQLMMELAMSGLDSAVVCSDQDCRLFVLRKQIAAVEADSSMTSQGT
ncbi:MAG: hypothetical protein GY895_10930 [Phycisphaera sp.]|nr:hypothetical protein [Phycisphaera sp.]